MFHERGYGETSLRQLIAETGMSPTAFYARYPSKQAVFEALVERLASRILVNAMTAFSSAAGADASFDAVPDILLRELAPEKALARLMITEAAVVPSLRVTLSGVYRAIAGVAAAQLKKMNVPEPEVAGWAMLGAIFIQIIRWVLFEEIDDATFVEQLRITVRLRPSLPPAGV